MTPLTLAVAELQLAIATAERRGVATLLEGARWAAQDGPMFEPGTLEDHRVAVAGDLADALDKIVPGLGHRFMQAMYPELDYSLSAEEAAEEVRRVFSSPGLPPADGPGRLQ